MKYQHVNIISSEFAFRLRLRLSHFQKKLMIGIFCGRLRYSEDRPDLWERAINMYQKKKKKNVYEEIANLE